MNDLQNINFDKLYQIYTKYFSLGYINTNNASDKLACISLICCITQEIRKKKPKITCYEVLLQIGKDFPDLMKNTFMKSLGAICEDLMYGCNTFPDFGIPLKEMPNTLRKLLDKYIPF